MADKNVYPRVPESNWWAIRAQFKKSLPATVTTGYLKSLLDLSSDKSANNLIPPLKQLGLLDDENKPTTLANDWRDDTKYKEACNTMLHKIYPDELIDLHSGPDYDRERIKSWFMHNAMLGEGAAGIVTSVYVYISQGELKNDADVGNNKPKAQKKAVNNIPKAKAATNAANVPSASNENRTESPAASAASSTPTLHIDLQVHISPDASAEQVDTIFASIAKHLYGR